MINITNEKYKGHLAILCTNIIFGLNIPVSKALLSGWISPLSLTLSRMLFATVVFWTIGLFAKKEKVDTKDLLIIAVGGLLGLVATQLSFAKALQYTSPVNFSLIVAMSPIVVMLLAALFLKEPITFKKFGGVLLGISGALLIIFHTQNSYSGTNNIKGILFAVLNIINYGLYLIITRSVSKKYSPLTLMKWMFLFAALMLFPFGAWDLGSEKIYSSGASLIGLSQLAFVLVFSTTIAYFLIPVALKRLRPTTTSMYNNLQPIIASTIAIITGQDIFNWDKPVAAILVIAGVFLVTRSKSKEDTERAVVKQN